MTLVLFALLASLAAGLLKFVALSRGDDFMRILKWFLYYLKIVSTHQNRWMVVAYATFIEKHSIETVSARNRVYSWKSNFQDSVFFFLFLFSFSLFKFKNSISTL